MADLDLKFVLSELDLTIQEALQKPPKCWHYELKSAVEKPWFSKRFRLCKYFINFINILLSMHYFFLVFVAVVVAAAADEDGVELICMVL